MCSSAGACLRLVRMAFVLMCSSVEAEKLRVASVNKMASRLVYCLVSSSVFFVDSCRFVAGSRVGKLVLVARRYNHVSSPTDSAM